MFGVDSSIRIKAETMAKKVFEKLGKDEKADAGIFKLVIGVFIVAILVGALIPTAVNSIILGKNASGTWDAGTTATFGALPILIVIVIVAVLAGLAYKAFND